MRAFVCRQFKKQDVLWASEIQAIRDFGSETATQQVQTEVARKMGRLRNDAEATFEFHLFNGIQGVVKDPKDGATVINYYTEFGITPAAEVDFDLDNASPASGALRKRCQALIESVEDEAIATSTAAGTPANIALKRFGHFNGSITRNGANIGNVVSADLTYANNLDRIETIRADGKIDGADPSIAALTGNIVVRFADQTLVTQAINGEACELEFSYTLPTGESLTVTAHAVYLPRPRIEISGPQGVQATFDWQAASDPVVGRMCTVTLTNDREVY